MSMKRHSFWGWVGAIWGFAGVALLLGFAIYRLTPLAVTALEMPLTGLQWTVLVVFVLFMAFSEGYRGFQKAFSPRVAARARYLRANPTPTRVLLAPFFCMAYFDAPRRRRIAAYALTLGVILLVVLVHQLDQPWRGIIDAGVVIGLAWGLLATFVFWIQALTRPEFGVSPEVA
jgi:hypothetical protein